MMKLELKHLAPYLPYGLKVAVKRYDFKERCENYNQIEDLISIKKENWSGGDCINPTSGTRNLDEIKPLLRLLNSLNEKDQSGMWYTVNNNGEFTGLPEAMHINGVWETYEYLFKNHYDVFGLIESGLAIDINTISKEQC